MYLLGVSIAIIIRSAQVKTDRIHCMVLSCLTHVITLARSADRHYCNNHSVGEYDVRSTSLMFMTKQALS